MLRVLVFQEGDLHLHFSCASFSLMTPPTDGVFWGLSNASNA